MTKYDKYLLRRIYHLLRHHKDAFIFQNMRFREGWCDTEFICINIKGNDTPILTLIHECLHYMYNRWTESVVIKKEKSMYYQLNIRQVKYLYKLMVNLM